ncbi:MAG TPA: hypothetical protein VJG32_17925 [Anaerolineae bacterium]|nr:hypothetical protein [Anaerolineae bacterium]
MTVSQKSTQRSSRRRPIDRMTKSDLKEVVVQLLEHTSLMPDDGYVRLAGGGLLWNDLDPIERSDALEASYYYWKRDPLMHRAVQLIKDYTFGRGVTWKAKEPRVSAVLSRFWKDKNNRIIAKAVGQWELAERIQLAGEVFPIFFVNTFTGHVKVRVVPPEEITDIITDPEDKDTTLYYQRTWVKQAFRWETKTWSGGRTRRDFIPDWDNRAGEYSTGARRQGTLVYMHHIKINSHGSRGDPLYYNALPWIKAYKGFMEDRATLTLAAATYAFKQRIKGSKAAVARLRQQWLDISTRYGETGSTTGKERREGAQTIIENENVSLEQFNFDTRSGNAYTDGRMLRQQVAAGTGITEQNLTGDPSVANLASATQMEGPMLKMFESWQQLWKDEYSDIFEFVIDMAVEYGDLPPDVDRTVEVNFPPIVIKDLPTIINAVAQLISAQSMAQIEYITPERLAGYILEAFGETDVDQALTDLKQIWAARAAIQSDLTLPDDMDDKVQAAMEAVRLWRRGEAPATTAADAMHALAESLRSHNNGNGLS